MPAAFPPWRTLPCLPGGLMGIVEVGRVSQWPVFFGFFRRLPDRLCRVSLSLGSPKSPNNHQRNCHQPNAMSRFSLVA